MRDPFALELKRSADAVELYYPISSAGYGVLVGLILMGLLSTVVGFSPALRPLWLGLLDVTLVGVAGNTVRLLWLSTVRFDLARDEVRHWFGTVGEVSEIRAIERDRNKRALRVVFRDEGRWAIPGVQERQRRQVG
jgi:hypothetical protein